MDRLTVGIDIGTTSIKAVAVDGEGNVVRRARLPHRVLSPTPDSLEHDARRAWWQGPRKALATLSKESPLDVAGVAVAAMVPSVTAVDRRGRPLTPGLLYGDGRGNRADARPEAASRKEGDIPTSGAEVMGFLEWTASQAPGAHGYWPAQAVANHALGGPPSVDFAVAFIASPLFGDSGWDPELCKACGASPEQLPLVDLPGGAAGRLDGSDGPVLAAGSVDVWCEQLVAGASEPGDVHVICGTTLIVWAVTEATGPSPHPAVWTVPHSLPELRMVGGASNAGGMFVDWVRRLSAKQPTGAGPDPGNIPIWIPYLRGERTPYHDPDRRAALHDLNLTHGPAELQQAAWESSAFVVRHHLELGGVTGRRIVATGGGTRVDGWMQAVADGTGLPVHVAAQPEGAARGAAFLARVAAGIETDVNEAARWAGTARVVEPRTRWHEAAAGRYDRFLELSGTPGAWP